MRADERRLDQLREVHIEPNYIKHAEGSVMISVGDTKVICTATVEEKVPPFMRGQGKGWITAEYSMLPRATEQRTIREAARGKVSGRTMEIQRLIGRALRSVVNLEKIGERTIWLDCDVIQADGGTRTASITGAFVAMVMAIEQCLQDERIRQMPVEDFLAATSVGIMEDDQAILDLCYEEDSKAIVDMNIVMTGSGEFVEIQGTGEEHSFSRTQLNTMLGYAEQGISSLISMQKKVLGKAGDKIDAGKIGSEKSGSDKNYSENTSPSEKGAGPKDGHTETSDTAKTNNGSGQEWLGSSQVKSERPLRR